MASAATAMNWSGRRLGDAGLRPRRLSGVAGVVGDRDGVAGCGLVGGIGIRKFRSEGKAGEMGKKESNGTVTPAAHVERGGRRGVKLSKLLRKSGPTGMFQGYVSCCSWWRHQKAKWILIVMEKFVHCDFG
jgi:hypothetical protein